MYDNQTIPGSNSAERPDLVIKKGNNFYVVDVTNPFENGAEAFQKARQKKVEKYAYLKDVLRRGRIRSVTVDAFIIGSLGAWDPDNEDILKLFTSKFDKTQFKNLCVSNCIKWSRDIYYEHTHGRGTTIGLPLPSQLPQ